MKKIVRKLNSPIKGQIKIPADKSISHRAVIFASLAKGKSIIKNFSAGKDPLSSLEICKKLGVNAELKNDLIINSDGKFTPAKTPLDCGNSGTTMRFFTGILAGQNFNSVLTGDESLSKRPMKRVIDPLTLMGADIQGKSGFAPLQIFGKKLNGIEYKCPLSSAQVKSSILLAGLQAEGKTVFHEPFLSRNHTEKMLEFMGANIQTRNCTTIIEKSELSPCTFEICGDISSAAYFMVMSAIVPNSDIILENVGLNPTRTGILEVLKLMGADFEILDKKELCKEPSGDIRIKFSNLKGVTIEGDLIPKLIDEIPVIAVLATQAEGKTVIKDAQDLRNKESDRIKCTVTELKKLGANIEETQDGMIIYGKTTLKGGCEVETYQDHRLAMSLFCAGLICEKEISINGFDWVNISFPEFEKIFETIFSD